MTGLLPVEGNYRLYLKSISRSTAQAHFWKLAPAFVCAMILAQENEVFVTENVTHKTEAGEEVSLSRVYYWNKGSKVPELMERPQESEPAPQRRTAVEVD